MFTKKRETIVGLMLISLLLVGRVRAGLAWPECKFFNMFINPLNLVFDIGAHVGDKTEFFLGCDAYVVCVEPQPACVATLKNRFRFRDEVVIVNRGLAAHPGKMKMLVCSNAPTISSFSKDWTQYSRFALQNFVWDKEIEVEMTTLDELIKTYGQPQFIKIDVENFEYEVLCGLTQKIPCISFEFAIEYINNVEKCLRRLSELGFDQFNFAVGEVPALVLSKWVSAEELLHKLCNEKFEVEGGLLWGDIYAR